MIVAQDTNEAVRIIARYGAYRPAWSKHRYTVALFQRQESGGVFVEFAVALQARPDRLEIYQALEASPEILPDRLFVEFALRRGLQHYNADLGEAFKNTRLIHDD